MKLFYALAASAIAAVLFGAPQHRQPVQESAPEVSEAVVPAPEVERKETARQNAPKSAMKQPGGPFADQYTITDVVTVVTTSPINGTVTTTNTTTTATVSFVGMSGDKAIYAGGAYRIAFCPTFGHTYGLAWKHLAAANTLICRNGYTIAIGTAKTGPFSYTHEQCFFCDKNNPLAGANARHTIAIAE